MKLKIEQIGTIEEIPDKNYVITIDPQDIEVIKEGFGNPPELDEFDCFFIITENGEHKEVLAIKRCIPWMWKNLYRISQEEEGE